MTNKDNVINLADRKMENEFPRNLRRINDGRTIRIPILDKFYEKDGELFYELKGENIPRKWADYTLEDFNKRR